MSTTLEAPAAQATDQAPVDRGQWVGFAVILSAMILNILDSTILNIAGHSIAADLSMSTSALEWVAAGYTLALAVGLMTGARLGDLFGRRRILMIGLAGFVGTSIVASLAWSGEALVAARVAQGLSAALMIPQTFGLIRDLFPPQHIGKAFAAFGPAIGLSTVLGPVVAGLLTKLDLFGTDWRILFWINVPIGVFAIVVGLRVLPEGRTTRPGLRLDIVGTLLFAAAGFALVFPLVDGRTLGWPTWAWGVMALAVPLLGAFVMQQRARLAAGRSPLVEVSVLRKRSYVSGVVFTLFFFGSVVAIGLVMGMFLQIGLGYSPMRSALYLAALAIGAFFGAGVGAWAATAVGRPILHVGLTIMAVGTIVLWASLRAAAYDVGLWSLAPGLSVFGLGMGMIFVPLFSIIMGEIEDHEVGSAAGLLESFQQLGASLGVAALGTLFFNTLDVESGGSAAAVADGRHLAAVDHTLLALLGVLVIAWVLGWFLPKKARVDH